MLDYLDLLRNYYYIARVLIDSKITGIVQVLEAAEDNLSRITIYKTSWEVKVSA